MVLLATQNDPCTKLCNPFAIMLDNLIKFTTERSTPVMIFLPFSTAVNSMSTAASVCQNKGCLTITSSALYMKLYQVWVNIINVQFHVNHRKQLKMRSTISWASALMYKILWDQFYKIYQIKFTMACRTYMCYKICINLCISSNIIPTSRIETSFKVFEEWKANKWVISQKATYFENI